MNQLKFFRFLVVLNGAVPLLMLAWDAYRGQLGANSVNYALHVTGILSLVFLFLALFITPLRRLTGWTGLIAIRRSLGLYAFGYSVLHVCIYVGLDRAMNLSGTLHEIMTRRYLQVGTAGFFLMAPLAVTSTNAMIHRLGPKRWKQLHRLAYVVATLGVIHYFLLVKSDVRQPLAFGAVLAVLLATRLAPHSQARPSRQESSIDPRIDKGATADNLSGTGIRKPWKGELKIVAIIRETPNVKTFRLAAANGGLFPFAYSPGQYLSVQLMIDGRRVNRSYTIASSPTRSDTCELSIKREESGLVSRYFHDRLNVGDVLSVTGPAGRFVFTGQEANSVLLIAAGVGITPMMSIVRYLADKSWSGDIYFLIVARTEQDLIFRDEIRRLQSAIPRLHVKATLTRCPAESLWNGERGRLSETLLTHFVPDVKGLPVYLCGPAEMMEATRQLLVSLGISEAQIKTEAFTSQRSETPIETGSEADSEEQAAADGTSEVINGTASVTFARTKRQKEISTDLSVLEAAEEMAIGLPYECRSGICGQCKTRLLEGRVVMDCEDALTAAEKASGLILACQARLLSNVIIDA